MTVNEPSMIGLSQQAHQMLRRLKEDGHFDEMTDAYRLGIGLAMTVGIIPPPISSTQTVFSVSTLDPDLKIRTAVQVVYADEIEGESVYRFAERLADWGVRELFLQSERGEIDFASMLSNVSRGVEVDVSST